MRCQQVETMRNADPEANASDSHVSFNAPGYDDTLYAMTEDELNQMAKRFIQARMAFSKASDMVIDAKAAMNKAGKSRAAWVSELSKDAHHQATGPGLNIQNVRKAASKEAEYQKAKVAHDDAVKERELKKADLEQAWESLVTASS